MSKKAIVVPATQSALATMLQTQLTEDNVANFICDIGGIVEDVGAAYHRGMAFMVATFGHDAVFGFSGNKCKGSTSDKKEASKKKHAVELGIEYSAFQRLYAIFTAITNRRADCWRQAKNCYITVEKRKSEATVVAIADKPEALLMLEVEHEEAKAELASAKAAKRLAEINLTKAKLEGEDEDTIADLAAEAQAAREAYEVADAERQHVAHKLQAERNKGKEDTEWTEFAKRVEALAEWCSKHEAYKGKADAVKALLVTK